MHPQGTPRFRSLHSAALSLRALIRMRLPLFLLQKAHLLALAHASSSELPPCFFSSDSSPSGPPRFLFGDCIRRFIPWRFQERRLQRGNALGADERGQRGRVVKETERLPDLLACGRPIRSARNSTLLVDSSPKPSAHAGCGRSPPTSPTRCRSTHVVVAILPSVLFVLLRFLHRKLPSSIPPLPLDFKHSHRNPRSMPSIDPQSPAARATRDRPRISTSQRSPGNPGSPACRPIRGPDHSHRTREFHSTSLHFAQSLKKEVTKSHSNLHSTTRLPSPARLAPHSRAPRVLRRPTGLRRLMRCSSWRSKRRPTHNRGASRGRRRRRHRRRRGRQA